MESVKYAGVIGESKNELKFMYESDASASFLVIRCDDEIIEYQVRMLENNDIGYIVPVEVAKKEGICHFFYNITSKIPLSLYLKRHKFSREDFLRVLLNVSVCINDSAGYLLASSNFVFNAEYVYIDPGTLDIMLVYIPARISGEAAGTLQAFVSDLLMQHINEEGFGSGNLVQRILSEIRSERFSINGFIKLINELLYGQDSNKTQLDLSKHDQEICNKTIEENVNYDKKEEKCNNKENIFRKKPAPFVIFAVLLQILIGTVIYLCRGLLENTGDDPAVTYAAVILIVLSVEVLIFKKLYTMKLFSISSSKQADTAGAGAVRDTVIGSTPNMDRLPHASEIRCKKGHKGDLRSSDKMAADGDSIICDISGICTDKGSDTGNTGKGYTVTNDFYQVQSKADTAILINDAVSVQKTELLTETPQRTYMLKCKNNANGGQDIIIDKDEFIIGRLAGHVDHVLENKAVGKLHAELIIRNGSCYVKDLNSINGTYVNNQRIESNKEIELKDNDNLLFANSEYIFISSLARA